MFRVTTTHPGASALRHPDSTFPGTNIARLQIFPRQNHDDSQFCQGILKPRLQFPGINFIPGKLESGRRKVLAKHSAVAGLPDRPGCNNWSRRSKSLHELESWYPAAGRFGVVIKNTFGAGLNGACARRSVLPTHSRCSRGSSCCLLGGTPQRQHSCHLCMAACRRPCCAWAPRLNLHQR